jgi:phosphatidylserine synthase
MNKIWLELLIIAVMVIISLVIFQGIRMYILPKFNISRKYVFIALLILIFLPFFLGKLYTYRIVQYAVMLGVSTTMLTYIEITRIEREKKNKPIVGRPKPKPNRIKEDK